MVNLRNYVLSKILNRFGSLNFHIHFILQFPEKIDPVFVLFDYKYCGNVVFLSRIVVVYLGGSFWLVMPH